MEFVFLINILYGVKGRELTEWYTILANGSLSSLIFTNAVYVLSVLRV